MTLGASYAFIVVGAGSAGSALAGRLTGGSDASVLLIEAGPRDPSAYIHIPGFLYKAIGGKRSTGISRVNRTQA